MPPVINMELCNGCGKCINVCLSDVFFGTKKSEIPIVTYPDECWHENACVAECPVEAIDLRIPLSMMVIYK